MIMVMFFKSKFKFFFSWDIMFNQYFL
jgi:hypothetical protein